MSLSQLNPNIQVRTFNSNSTTSLSLEVTESGTLLLPSTLINSILNFNFNLNNNPVITGITGSLILTAQYLNGPIVPLGTIDLATANTFTIFGKYTQINATVPSLTGADTVIIYADQSINIIPAASGTGIQTLNGNAAINQTLIGGIGIDVSSGGGVTTITNTGAGSVTPLQIQKQAFTYAATDTGTANNYIITLFPPVASLVDGMEFSVKIANTNTSSSAFLTADGVHATPIINTDQTPILIGDIVANGISYFIYDGGVFQLINPQMSNPTAVKTEIVYVSNQGSDTSGDGTCVNPYATIFFANSSITDNSATKPYIISATGILTDGDYSPKPYVTLELNGSSYTVTNPVVLDPSWNGNSGTLIIQNGYDISFQGGINLDFDSAASPFALVRLSNIITAASSLFNITGNSSGTTISIISEILGFSNQPDISITNSYGGISGGAPANVTVNHTSETTGANFNISNLIELGNFSVTDNTTTGMTLFLTNNKCYSLATFTGSGSGAFNIYDRGGLYINPVTLAGATVQYNVDTFTALPILAGGATFTATTLANSINANHVPINYSAADDSVQAAIVGLDTALGSIGPSGNTIYTANDTITGNRDVGMSTFQLGFTGTYTQLLINTNDSNIRINTPVIAFQGTNNLFYNTNGGQPNATDSIIFNCDNSFTNNASNLFAVNSSGIGCSRANATIINCNGADVSFVGDGAVIIGGNGAGATNAYDTLISCTNAHLTNTAGDNGLILNSDSIFVRGGPRWLIGNTTNATGASQITASGPQNLLLSSDNPTFQGATGYSAIISSINSTINGTNNRLFVLFGDANTVSGASAANSGTIGGSNCTLQSQGSGMIFSDNCTTDTSGANNLIASSQYVNYVGANQATYLSVLNNVGDITGGNKVVALAGQRLIFSSTAVRSSILCGVLNTNGGTNSTIFAGESCTIGTSLDSAVGGKGARSLNFNNVYVWSDGSTTNYDAAANNTYSIQASGGISLASSIINLPAFAGGGSQSLGVDNTGKLVTLAASGVSSITGTANQVIASASTGAVTLSLPQSINTGANVIFNQVIATLIGNASSATTATTASSLTGTVSNASWAVSDQSGAGVGFSYTAKYSQLGPITTFSVMLVIGSNSSGANFAIGGLPSIPSNTISISITPISLTGAYSAVVDGSTGQIWIYKDGTRVTNASLSFQQVRISGTYS